MAQNVLHLHRRRDPAGDVKVREAHQLGVEKLGVILGFLMGLLVGFGLVATALIALDAPGWLTFIAGALVTAAFTRSGQVLALTLARYERVDASSGEL